MRRVDWSAGVLAAGLLLWGAPPASAQDTRPGACVNAYNAAARLQSYMKSAAAKGEGLHGLGGWTDNWHPTHVWDTRAKQVNEKLPESERFLFGVSEAGQRRGDQLMLEGSATGLLLMLSPEKVFVGQRQLFAEVRACDLAYGFEPALGVAPAGEAILAILQAQEAKRSAQSLARLDALANLNDAQCAARFLVMGSVMAGDPGFQQVMTRKIQIAQGRALEADARLTAEQFAEQAQRDARERSAVIRTPEDLTPLLEEVNACERKYGEPLTQKG